MKKVLYLVADGSEEIEVVAPVDLLRRAGVEVTLAGVGLGGRTAADGSHGIGIGADVAFDGEVVGYDAIVVPGGMRGVKGLLAEDSVGEALKKAHAAGIWVAAICAGPWVPAKAGVVGPGPYTCYPGCEGEVDGGANWRNEAVVVDAAGKVVTSQGAGTAIEFGLALIEVLVGREAAEKVASAVVWKGTMR